MIPHKQLSFADIFTDCQNKYDTKIGELCSERPIKKRPQKTLSYLKAFPTGTF